MKGPDIERILIYPARSPGDPTGDLVPDLFTDPGALLAAALSWYVPRP